MSGLERRKWRRRGRGGMRGVWKKVKWLNQKI